MGIFFNPGNGSFTKDRNYEIYVDKTELTKILEQSHWNTIKIVLLSAMPDGLESHMLRG